MGVEAPAMYDRPLTASFSAPSDRGYTPFSSKVATPDGPLLKAHELKQQSDSYFVVYGRLSVRFHCPMLTPLYSPYKPHEWKPMSKSTKPKIKWLRIMLLNVRICSLLGALGLLFCIICIRPTNLSVDWIIRAVPGVGVLQSGYAVYHLCRSAKNRTPASSASYMMFAAIVDACFVPFLAFLAYLADAEDNTPFEATDHWQTLFAEQFQTTNIIYATFLASIATGAAHAVAFVLSLYIANIFRRIAKLPPDMNPLEDRLTSRHSHKRNKSSMSTISTSPARPSNTSDQPLIEKSRLHSYQDPRGRSGNNIPSSPHRVSAPPNTRESPMSFLALPYQPTPGPAQSNLRRSPAQAQNRNSAPVLGPLGDPPEDWSPKRRPHSMYPEVCKTPGNDENWIVHEEPLSVKPAERASTGPAELQHLRLARGTWPDSAPSSPPRQRPTQFELQNRSPRPLGLNPPSPIRLQQRQQQQHNRGTGAATSRTERTRRAHRTPEGREKRQVLRDLVNHAGGFDGSPVTWEEVNLRPSKERLVEDNMSHGVVAGATSGKGKGRFYGSLRGMISGSGYRYEGDENVDEGEGAGALLRAHGNNNNNNGGKRAVSSGFDDGVALSKSGIRGRDVSGKIAEEGRSTMMH